MATQTTVVLLEDASLPATPAVRPAAPDDDDGDGIPNNEDDYPNDHRLPVVVETDPGSRPSTISDRYLDCTNCTGGVWTRERVSKPAHRERREWRWGTTVHSASASSEPGFDVVYDFEIYNVDYANARRVAGGVAGVIIPLPESLYARVALLPFKYPSGRPFAVSDDGDDYGFAPLSNGRHVSE